MVKALALGVLAFGAVAACGDDATYAIDQPARTSHCAPGGFAEVGDPVGAYNVVYRFEGGFAQTGAFRIARSGPGLVLRQGELDTPLVTEGRARVATLGTARDGTSYRFTDVDAACGITGTYASCRSGACYTYAIEARPLAPLDEARAFGLHALGEFAGTAADPWLASGLPVNVRVAEGVAYVADYRDGLRLVDVRDPAHLRELGHVPTRSGDPDEIWNDVKLTRAGGRSYALMASSVVGVEVVDVTDPAAPAVAARLGERWRNVHTLFVDGARAYLAASEQGLEIWDIADPLHATQVGAWTHPASASLSPYLHDLYVDGDRAYLNYWDLGLAIVDVRDPASPALVGTFTGYGETTSHSSWVTTIAGARIAVHGDEQWGAHVRVVDVTEGSPGFGTALAAWQTRPEVSVHNLMAFGRLAFLTHYQDGVRVLDLSDPWHPHSLAWFNTWSADEPGTGVSFYEGAVGLDVDLVARRIYVADTHRGLLVLAMDFAPP
ncbi:MAG: hypothetical protein K8W52_43350 [Deltaproteobacteria bacterium]|nr:hypothetical protein [Deltaproteobacteria bacterium]